MEFDNINHTAFTSLQLRTELLENMDFLGYSVMTPIQAQSLPLVLKGHDIIAQAQTGSGKTAAFGLGLLNSLNIENYLTQALILCPTRELADQVAQSLRQLARLMPNVKILNLSGGIPIKVQLDSLKHAPQIIVGTPGRVKKHLEKETINFAKLKTLVLDEADRMLDMGFYDDICDIIEYCPKNCQTLLFSATYPEQIKQLASDFMHKPKMVTIEEEQTPLEIEQVFYEVKSRAQKFNLLKTVLLNFKPVSTIIFCNTKEQTTTLANDLEQAGFSAIALNGDMEQVQRDTAIIRFKNQSCSILVATDVAARGLDIKDLPAVINYELAFDPEVHVHRVGRTGRAGSKGLAINIVTPADAQRLCAIEDGLKTIASFSDPSELVAEQEAFPSPQMITLKLNVGRKDKIRPGDILGALTKDAGLDGNDIGKIDITALYSFVAIHKNKVKLALNYFKNGKVKGCKVNVRQL